ncbi:HAD-IIB family hydrolase [Planctomicrobium piriforme]|uniref:sucrose-phosphate synthase n=1 Tax=Planctomicrobium piriforme TaxID=1576369 RepID=A0A1I3FSM2_9PLAN|nr:HAD-IIB family hydrolase [Planctomicrobium piriforme]SFI14216.1 sucrose-phosphate synthase [Planctomicrobium piriforme]
MYLQLISLHGLVRGQCIEMGRDADTGGQVRYVIDLARQLARCPGVDQVDLFTRRIRDKRVANDYSAPIEQLDHNCRIVRLACGGGKYLRKERLWPCLDEYVDRMIAFTRKSGRVPSIVHGHYADGGYVAREVASVFDVPFVFTGHSLGKPKLDYLLEEGWTRDDANKVLAIDQRIHVEQECLAAADLVVCSTRHERDTAYASYFRDDDLRIEVIPPGTDLQRFFPYYEYQLNPQGVGEEFKQARVRMERALSRFFFQPDKPLILALCRPDRRKNIQALIKAYGESKPLQAIANLAILAGIREDIESMPDNERQVLTDMLLMMDRYDLYGKMAIPKHHDSELEVPELYRLAAAGRGVFVNTAYVELFGLTFIESSATGLPFVGTQNGGPQDIVENCESGIIVDVNQQSQVTDALLTLLTDQEQWSQASSNGINRVRQHYSWDVHCETFLSCLKDVVAAPVKTPSVVGRIAPGARLGNVDAMLLTDIDNTLLGDDDALYRLLEMLKDQRGRLGFGVASGRALELVEEVLDEHGINDIDVIVASVGTEIYYGRTFVMDRGWAARLKHKWCPDRIRGAMDAFPYLSLQPEPSTQREFKISYHFDGSIDSQLAIAQIQDALDQTRSAYSLIFSHGSFVDILPHRASKGKAVRYLSQKWQVPLERIATGGDSGNDLDMLTGRTAGIVVGNHSSELEPLRTSPHRIYFANGKYANGLIEGLQHYGLLSAPIKDGDDEISLPQSRTGQSA